MSEMIINRYINAMNDNAQYVRFAEDNEVFACDSIRFEGTYYNYEFVYSLPLQKYILVNTNNPTLYPSQ
jgi:hypothetical protein